MGLLYSIIAIGILALAIIGLGPVAFFTGVYNGFHVILTSPQVAHAVGAFQAWITGAIQGALPR